MAKAKYQQALDISYQYKAVVLTVFISDWDLSVPNSAVICTTPVKETLRYNSYVHQVQA